jgi:glycolate oxidase FAD binding subunit
MTTPSSNNPLAALAGAASRIASGKDVADYEVDGIRPSVIAHPADVEQLAEVVSLAGNAGLSVTPWGGGTHIDLGNPPERLDIVVDLAGLNQVIDYPAADLTVTVQSGVTFSALSKTLADSDQWLAIDPPLPHLATLGGVLATGLSGPTKWQYWAPRDVVIGMKIVQPDGSITVSGGQVVKNVSGYDMSRMHIGGLGTLGIIAEVSLKLTPLPRQQATLVASYDSAASCLGAALDVFHSDVVPLAITAFDSAAARRMSALPAEGGHTLAIRLGGRPRTLERQMRETLVKLESAGLEQIETLADKDAARLWRELADFAWDEATRPLLGVRASVTPSACQGLVESLKNIAAPDGMEPAVVSHPAHGTVLACWYADDAIPDSAIAELAAVVRSATEKAGGRLVVEHAPVGAKSLVDVWGEPGAPIALMKRFKERYDPQRLLNPGRFVGGI